MEKLMDVNRIVSELDAEIARLQKIRTALTGIGNTTFAAGKGKRGRPKGSKNLALAASADVAVKAAAKKSKTKRKLSPEGRKRIAEAMKRRWAAHRKEAQGK
jgi:acyl-CoA reductase-like NAD-dependent aldehyde dehydrogenase